MAAHLIRDKAQSSCGGQQSPLDDPVSDRLSNLVLPHSPFCSFCSCHIDLLDHSSDTSRGTLLPGLCTYCFLCLMIFPQKLTLFAFLLHDDVCSNITLPERPSLSIRLKNSNFPPSSSHFSLSPLLCFIFLCRTYHPLIHYIFLFLSVIVCPPPTRMEAP